MDFLCGSIHEGNLSLDSGMFGGYAQPLDVPFFYSYETTKRMD
jgi:hypothetical protein